MSVCMMYLKYFDQIYTKHIFWDNKWREKIFWKILLNKSLFLAKKPKIIFNLILQKMATVLFYLCQKQVGALYDLGFGTNSLPKNLPFSWFYIKTYREYCFLHIFCSSVETTRGSIHYYLTKFSPNIYLGSKYMHQIYLEEYRKIVLQKNVMYCNRYFTKMLPVVKFI